LESNGTTADFVLGLLGAETVPGLSLAVSGHLATRTPPSDQLVGMHLALQLHEGEVGAQDHSGLQGMQRLMRASRDPFQTFVAR
jgi:hypothetical protein